jgi:hypothetical protein
MKIYKNGSNICLAVPMNTAAMIKSTPKLFYNQDIESRIRSLTGF